MCAEAAAFSCAPGCGQQSAPCRKRVLATSRQQNFGGAFIGNGRHSPQYHYILQFQPIALFLCLRNIGDGSLSVTIQFQSVKGVSLEKAFRPDLLQGCCSCYTVWAQSMVRTSQSKFMLPLKLILYPPCRGPLPLAQSGVLAARLVGLEPMAAGCGFPQAKGLVLLGLKMK